MTGKDSMIGNGLNDETIRIKKEAEKEKRNRKSGSLEKGGTNQEINNETGEVKGGAPVDGGWAWVILAACVFEIIIYGGLLRSLGVFFLQYQTRFNSNASETALMSLIQNVVLSVTVIFVMTVGLKTFSSRVAVFIGGCFTVAAYMVTGFATDIRVFYFAQGVLGGIGLAMIHSPMLAVIGVYFYKHRGLANSVFNGGGSVGGLIFAPIIVKIFEEYQFTGAMLIFSGLLMNICVSALVLRPIETYHKKKRFIDEGTEITEQDKLLLQKDSNKSKNNFDKQALKLNGINLEAGLFLSDNKLNRKHHPLAKSNDSNHLQTLEPKFIDHQSKESPLLQRVRAYSVGIRQRTLSEHNQRYDSENNLHHRKNPIKGVIDAISRSQVALYASSNGMYGSVIDVDMQPGNLSNHPKDHDNKGEKEIVEPTEAAVGCGSNIKSCFISVLCTVFDLGLLRNPVFITYLLMAFSIHAGLHLVPIFMPAHAKDIGISNENIGLLISLTMVIDLISKILVGVIADRKLVRTPTILVIVSIVMGTTSHLLRYVNSFSSLLVFVVVVGICCGQYMSLFGVVLMEVIGPEKFKSSLGFGQLVHGATIAIFFPVTGLLRDVTGSYVASYHLLGSLTYLAGAMAFIIPIVNKRKGRDSITKHVDV